MQLLTILKASLALLATTVVARPHGIIISTHVERNTEASPSTDCDMTCEAFLAASMDCATPHCGCNNQYLQTRGDCLLCQRTDPPSEALVRIFLDVEIHQCHSEGIDVNLKLQLSPDAQAIVDDFDRKNSRLRVQQTAFLALQIAGGHVGLAILLVCAIFSRNVHRDPTFLNFCITWIFSSVVYSLSLYRGTDGNTVAFSLLVSPTKCLAQAALVNGAQVMTACSTMALVIQLWIGLRAAIYGDIFHGPKQKQWTTVGLVVLPYICLAAFALPSIFVGTALISIQKSPLQQVLPSNFYCSFNHELKPLSRAVYGATLGFLLIAAVFDVLIIILLYRHWWAVRTVHMKSSVSLPTLLRVVVFSIYRVIIAFAYGSVLKIPPPHDVRMTGSRLAFAMSNALPVWVDMLQAAIPLVGFLILGVNGDMLSAMFFCRRNKKSMSTVQTINTTNAVGSGSVDMT